MSEKNVIDLTSASQGISRKKRGNKLKSVYGLFSVDEQLSVADFNISDVVESLSDGFALYDANDNLVLWNSKFANIISHAKDILRPGVAFRELVAKCANEHVVNGLINQEQRDIWIDEACEFQRECGTYERETPDGKCYLVSRRKTSEGLIAVVWTDITENKRSKEALTESDNLYKKLFENSGQGIVIQQNNNVIMANQTFLSMFGLSESARINTVLELDDLISPCDRGKVREIRENALLNEEGSQNYEFQGVKKDGSNFWVQAIVTNIYWKNQKALQTTYSDITERKQFDEELLNRKLETVGVMAKGFALEYQKIHSAIMGQIRLAKLDAYALGIESISDALSEAEVFDSYLEQLTQQLLYLYRGGIPFKEMASIEDLLKSSLPTRSYWENNIISIEKSKVNIKLDLGAHLLPVKVDKKQIIQVFQTLIEKGSTAMPFGGTLKIKASNLPRHNKSKPIALPFGDYVKVSIADQGEGVPGEYISRIFDPYHSYDGKVGGMELAHSYTIIKQHSGTITATSRVGKGTTMNVFLPASS